MNGIEQPQSVKAESVKRRATRRRLCRMARVVGCAGESEWASQVLKSTGLAGEQRAGDLPGCSCRPASRQEPPDTRRQPPPPVRHQPDAGAIRSVLATARRSPARPRRLASSGCKASGHLISCRSAIKIPQLHRVVHSYPHVHPHTSAFRSC